MENANTIGITLGMEYDQELYKFRRIMTLFKIWDEDLIMLDNFIRLYNINEIRKLNKRLFDDKLLPELFECFWNQNLHILKKRNIIYYTSLDDLTELKELRYLKLEEVTQKDFDFFN